MSLSHYHALTVSYVLAMIIWLLVFRFWPHLWKKPFESQFTQPWLEFLIALGAAVGVLGIGQLYQHVWRLPTDGPMGTLLETINQTVIFSPMLILLILRRHPLRSAWVCLDHLWIRLLIGFCLALLSLFIFSVARSSSASWWDLVRGIYKLRHLDAAVQVLLEDLTIAILFVRLEGALRKRWMAIIVVAVLFAAGHIPSMLSSGGRAGDLLWLFLDLGLGVMVLTVISRAGDITWFWCVHYALDMTQYAPGA